MKRDEVINDGIAAHFFIVRKGVLQSLRSIQYLGHSLVTFKGVREGRVCRWMRQPLLLVDIEAVLAEVKLLRRILRFLQKEINFCLCLVHATRVSTLGLYKIKFVACLVHQSWFS